MSLLAYAVSSGAAASTAEAKISTIKNEFNANAGFESPEERENRLSNGERKRTAVMLAHAGVASAAVAAALGSMYVEGSMICYVAFAFTLGVAPVMIVQRRKLNKIESLRKIQNDLRHEVNRLAEESRTLSHQNNALERQVTKLREVEGRLTNVVQIQGHGIDEFRNLVKENKRIQTAIKQNLKGKIIQDILKTCYECDRNGDFHFNDREIDVLVMHLQTYPGMHKVDTSKLRESFQTTSSRSMQSILKTAQDVLAVSEVD